MQVPHAILQAAKSADSLNEYIALHHEEVCGALGAMLLQCKDKSVTETRHALPLLGRVLHALQPQLCRSQEMSTNLVALDVHLLLASHQAQQEHSLDARTATWAAGHLQECQSAGAGDEEALMGSLGFLQQDLAKAIVDDRQEAIQRLCGAKAKMVEDSSGTKRKRGDARILDIDVKRCAALDSVWPLLADERLGAALAESVTRVSGHGGTHLKREVRPSVPLARLLSSHAIASLYCTNPTVLCDQVREQLNAVALAPYTSNADMRVQTDLWALAASSNADLATHVDHTLCATLLSPTSTFAHARLYCCYHTALASLSETHLSDHITVLHCICVLFLTLAQHFSRPVSSFVQLLVATTSSRHLFREIATQLPTIEALPIPERQQAWLHTLRHLRVLHEALKLLFIRESSSLDVLPYVAWVLMPMRASRRQAIRTSLAAAIQELRRQGTYGLGDIAMNLNSNLDFAAETTLSSLLLLYQSLTNHTGDPYALSSPPGSEAASAFLMENNC